MSPCFAFVELIFGRKRLSAAERRKRPFRPTAVPLEARTSLSQAVVGAPITLRPPGGITVSTVHAVEASAQPTIKDRIRVQLNEMPGIAVGPSSAEPAVKDRIHISLVGAKARALPTSSAQPAVKDRIHISLDVLSSHLPSSL
jgi:hypothetical protein